MIETVDCNDEICKSCIKDTNRFTFSKVELEVWNILNISERRQLCNIPISDRSIFLEGKRKEKKL